MNYSRYGQKKKLLKINSPYTKITNLISSIFIKLVVFMMVVAIVIAINAGVGAVNAIIATAPDVEVLLTQINPEGFKTTIYDLNGNIVEELHSSSSNRVYKEFDQIPDYLSNAYVAIEDERFYEHNGIDLKGVMRAVFTVLKDKNFTNPEGASTITQQIIKNNVLTDEVTIERKIQEMYLAIQLEKYESKESILELYMNTVANGRGTNGVQTASKLYFNKNVEDITIAESAVLASITNNPTKYDPITNPENNRIRAERIINKLFEQGYITDIEYETALNEDVYKLVMDNRNLIEENSSYSYFVDETIQRVATDLVIEKGYTESQAYNLIYRGGLSIYVTQDSSIQSAMDNVFTNEDNFPPELEDYEVKVLYSITAKNGSSQHYEEVFNNLEESRTFINQTRNDLDITQEDIDTGLASEKVVYIPQPQAAMVMMDSYTGYIKAISGGRGEKEGNQTFNRASQSLRQPGSTFKILASYLPAIDVKGYNLATVIDDVPTEILQEDGNIYSPKNWYKRYKGLSSVREGIVYSMNILAVKTIFDIGTDIAFDYLDKLGFTSIYESKTINGQIFTDKTLSLPLGGLTEGVSPLELTAAYGAIANGGTYIEPIFYTKVLDHDGNIILENEPIKRIVMKNTTAFLLTDAMKDVVDYGTGTSVKFKESDMALAGKTGTTSSTKDLWSGYSPYYTAVVWMGYDDPKKMAYLNNYHKFIWRDVMEAAHKNLGYKEFEEPAGLIKVDICTESGKLAIADLCSLDPRGSTIKSEYFVVGTEPTKECDVHVKVEICDTANLFVTEYCPLDTIVSKVMIVRPEPLQYEIMSEDMSELIEDYQYEIPQSMIGEYCNMHGPEFEIEVTEPIKSIQEEVIEF